MDDRMNTMKYQNSTFLYRHRMAGVTLMELMIVVVIVGILAAIGVPSYRQYAMRANRTEAKSALLQLATNQERFYLQNNAYSLDPVALGFAGGTSEFGVYDLTIVTANGVTQDYTATARPAVGGGTNSVDMTQDNECATFSISSTGTRTATPAPNGAAGRCW
jgi:type IV pilus assembly protein PilE